MKASPLYGKHYKGWKHPKDYFSKKKTRRKMAARSRARNFKGA